ncbi:MAG: hypothetical protein J6C19_08650 [Lachnospiraceae bacterium]|nr:hypothetical protein [Lachnospiraceae bacterium]
MLEKDVRTLHNFVKKFKRFQKQYYPKKTEENDNGEWEIGIPPHLLIETLDYPEWFELLCRHSIETDYYNARWQFAEQIGSYKGESVNIFPNRRRNMP